MKLKNKFIALVLIIFSSSIMNAARFTVYNDDVQDLYVQITSAKHQPLKANIIPKGKSITYNTYALTSFGSLKWGLLPPMFGVDIARAQVPTKVYRLNVSSPGNMLTGSVHIKADGSFAKNFSPEKVGIPKEGGTRGVHFGKLDLTGTSQ